QRTLRSRVFTSLGQDGRDPEALANGRRIAEKALANPSSVDGQLAGAAFSVAAVNGDAEFFDKLMAGLKNPKSPEQYYQYFYTLPQFTDQKLLQRTLDYGVSPDVRSQDALGLVTNVLGNPDGEKLAWDFIRQHWAEIE